MPRVIDDPVQMLEAIAAHLEKTTKCLTDQVAAGASRLLEHIESTRDAHRSVFVCGNGGSAANALHWANDMVYGAAKGGKRGIRCHALPANPSICTCLANDEGYGNVFSAQLEVLARKGDVLIVLSGSGNSPNILQAIQTAKTIGMISWAIVGFDGGIAKSTADHHIHLEVDDMQIAEDCQTILCHCLTRRLAGEQP